jgi:transcriptional regulator with XRE-family HTH domain
MLYHGKIRDVEALGQMLAQARLISGLSQRELADRLGVSQRYIWEMEAGRPTTYARRLFAFMAATGMALTAEIDSGPADG